jgi:hypothetical protein
MGGVKRAFLSFLAVLFLLAGCGSGDGGSASATARAAEVASSAPSAEGVPSSAADSSAAPAESAAAQRDKPLATPLLWEVTSKERQVSYVLGTMHLGIDAEKELHPIVLQRLDASHVLIVELDMDIDPLAAVDVAMLPEGTTVHDKLSPGRWQVLVDRVGGFLTPESSLRRMKPWVLATLFMQTMLPKTEPMDGVLYERHKKAKKELVFLETLGEQAKMIERAMDVKFLDDMLGDVPAAEKLMADMAAAYKAGDAEALAKLTFDPEEMKKHPAMFQVLLFDRNERWMPKLLPAVEKGGAFVAVGAAHLLGDKGLLELLAKKGLAVSRVTAQ